MVGGVWGLMLVVVVAAAVAGRGEELRTEHG